MPHAMGAGSLYSKCFSPFENESPHLFGVVPVDAFGPPVLGHSFRRVEDVPDRSAILMI